MVEVEVVARGIPRGCSSSVAEEGYKTLEEWRGGGIILLPNRRASIFC
jgi:hypothetical protein